MRSCHGSGFSEFGWCFWGHDGRRVGFGKVPSAAAVGIAPPIIASAAKVSKSLRGNLAINLLSSELALGVCQSGFRPDRSGGHTAGGWMRAPRGRSAGMADTRIGTMPLSVRYLHLRGHPQTLRAGQRKHSTFERCRGTITRPGQSICPISNTGADRFSSPGMCHRG